MKNENRIISNEELLVSNMIEIQAVIRVLKNKGIATEDEIMREIVALKAEMDELVRKAGKEN